MRRFLGACREFEPAAQFVIRLRRQIKRVRCGLCRREALARLLVMLCGDTTVVQSSVLDGLPFDPFSFQEDRLAMSEADVGRGQVGDALVVSQMVVVGDELADLRLELARQVIVFSSRVRFLSV